MNLNKMKLLFDKRITCLNFMEGNFYGLLTFSPTLEMTPSPCQFKRRREWCEFQPKKERLKIKPLLNFLPNYNLRMLKVAILLLFCISFTQIQADENQAVFEKANTEYANGNYPTAIQLYESILKNELEAAELYYNLGNAYYKSNDLAKAIINFERAKKMDPDNEDITFNLKLANQKTEDKIESLPQIFLTEWKEGLMNGMSEKSWSVYSILALSASLLLYVLYFTSTNRNFKQLGFFGGSIVLLLALFSLVTASQKYKLTKNNMEAIITSATVTATGSPNEAGTKLFVLHLGTKVKINKNNGDWMEIKIANGNVGWVNSKTLEVI